MQAGVPPRSAPRRILIVEDNELNLKLLKDILEVHGYMTIVGGMGAVAIDLARQYRPDLDLVGYQAAGYHGVPRSRGISRPMRRRGKSRSLRSPHSRCLASEQEFSRAVAMTTCSSRSMFASFLN